MNQSMQPLSVCTITCFRFYDPSNEADILMQPFVIQNQREALYKKRCIEALFKNYASPVGTPEILQIWKEQEVWASIMVSYLLNQTPPFFCKYTWTANQEKGFASIIIPEGKERSLLEDPSFQFPNLRLLNLDQQVVVVYRSQEKNKHTFKLEDLKDKSEETPEIVLLKLFWNTRWTQFGINNSSSDQDGNAITFTKIRANGQPINPQDVIPVPQINNRSELHPKTNPAVTDKTKMEDSEAETEHYSENQSPSVPDKHSKLPPPPLARPSLSLNAAATEKSQNHHSSTPTNSKPQTNPLTTIRKPLSPANRNGRKTPISNSPNSSTTNQKSRGVLVLPPPPNRKTSLQPKTLETTITSRSEQQDKERGSSLETIHQNPPDLDVDTQEFLEYLSEETPTEVKKEEKKTKIVIPNARGRAPNDRSDKSKTLPLSKAAPTKPIANQRFMAPTKSSANGHANPRAAHRPPNHGKDNRGKDNR